MSFNLEEFCCGLIVRRFEDDHPVKVYHKFQDDENECLAYFLKHINWDDLKDSQVIDDLTEFYRYIQETHYADRSFEENLYQCLSQIGNLDGIDITSEDGKHHCVVKKVDIPNMSMYKLDIDGKTSIIYEINSIFREISMFSMIVLGHYFD